MKIKKIYELKNAFVENVHTGLIVGKQNILVVEYSNKTQRLIDMQGKLDVTDIDYLKVHIKRGETKVKKIIFEERESGLNE